MTLLSFYLIGVVLSAVITIYEVKDWKKYTLGDVSTFFLCISLSWVSIFGWVFISKSSVFDIVIWRK